MKRDPTSSKQKKKQQPAKPLAPLSPSRKRMFTVILILLPILFFVITELGLRAFNYGGNFDLVVTQKLFGKEYYTLNREVARRYFSQSDIAVPEVAGDLFEIKKQPNTKRIFMLGESTMAGYPFEFNATAGHLLQDRLQQLLPQYHFEVVNTGLAAINSYTILDFAKDLVNYSPDAFVVYVGHNEFYGALGVGSTEYLGQWRWMINTYLKLRSLKLFLAMRDGVVALRNLIHRDPTPKNSTLMEAMVGNKTILYNSPEYLIAKRNFEANLQDLIDLCHEHHIPVVLSTLASNLKDQDPLVSMFSENTSDQTKHEFQEDLNKGRSFEKTDSLHQAAQEFRQAIALDTMQADAHMALAVCLDRMGDSVGAKSEYVKARDYDGLRFRATSDFNTMIRSLCANSNVPLADAEKTFDQNSPENITGHTLILEHLHPNFDGYFLLAKTFFQTIVDNDVLVPKSAWAWNNQLTDEQFKEKSGVTRFDLEVANYRIFNLMHHWPFVKNDRAYAPYPVKDRVSEIAVQYSTSRIGWSVARLNLGEWFDKQGDFKDARNEYYALSKIMWYYYLPFMHLGDMYRELNDTVHAEEAYKQSLANEETPFVHVRMGMLYYTEHRTTEAIQQFEAVFQSERFESALNASDQSLARYFLAGSYLAANNTSKAIENLRIAIQLDPKNNDAKRMLSLIAH